MWTAVFPIQYLQNSTFWLINDSKKEPLSYWLFESNLDKRWIHFYKTLTFQYQSRDSFKNMDCSISTLILAKFDLSINKRPPKKELLYIYSSNQIVTKVISHLLQNSKFWLINGSKKNSFISMLQTKFGQKL